MEFRGIKLFATSNDIERLSKPLISRLMEFHLPEDHFDEFREIEKVVVITVYEP